MLGRRVDDGSCAAGRRAGRERAGVPMDTTRGSAQVGVTGLAVMGRNLARNLARHGYRVAVHNRTAERTRALVAEHGTEGRFVASESMADFVASLAPPRIVIVMVKAGPPTDEVIGRIAPLLEAGDIIADCGNAHYADTRRRERERRGRGIYFVGTGVSGGEEGALRGPSIMPGGSAQAYQVIGPVFESIAARVDGTPCCVHVGPDGAGHFVKMVHNGIEYADMQLIAEAYDLLRAGTGASPARLAEVFRAWNDGELESFLIEITADVLGHVDAATGRSSTSCSTRPSRRAPAAGPCRRRSTSASRSPASPRPRSPARCPATPASAPPRGGRSATARGRGRPRTGTRSPRTSAGRCRPRRWSPTRRASIRSRRAAPSTAGTSTAARWRRSGGADASSARGSSTGSARPTRRTRPFPACSWRRTSPR